MKWRSSWVEVEMELGVELELGNILCFVIMSNNKVYTFIFSPPARMAWLTAKMYKVPADIVQVFYNAAFIFGPDRSPRSNVSVCVN